MKILSRKFYEEDTLIVAKKLLGKKLVRVIDNKYIVSTIAETECYRSDDPASHCFSGVTQRNKSMFGPVGHAYVYISYGIHFCLNIVARDENFKAGGVLIRSVITDKIINGPGKLTKALNITKKEDSIDITDKNSGLFILDNVDIEDKFIENSKRIGISKAKDKLWRFSLNKLTYLV